MIPRNALLHYGFPFLLLLVAVLGILFWEVIGGTLGDFVNRTGIILELLGVLSAVPEILGEEKFTRVEQNFQTLSQRFEQGRSQIKHFLETRDVDAILSSFLDIRGITGLVVLLADSLISVTLLAIWLHYIFFPSDLRRLPSERITRPLFGIIASAWIGLFLTSVLFEMMGKKPPSFMMWIFLGVHIFISMFAFPISAALACVVQLALASSKLLLQFQLRQVIIWVTIPLVIVGNFFQLVATFL